MKTISLVKQLVAVVVVVLLQRNTVGSLATSKTSTTVAATSLTRLATSLIESPTAAVTVPTNGLIDYIGRTDGVPLPDTDTVKFVPQTKSQLFSTRFNLWKQFPWKKIKGKAIIKAKLGGAIPLESAPPSGLSAIGSQKDLSEVDSLTQVMNMFQYAAYDPRIKAIFLEIKSVGCGYAKLKEIRRSMEFFKQSGKEIIGYCEGASEKELYLALGLSEFYVPPDGGLDLRGFSGSATFLRGVLDEIGIEPQVQRIGKYKSAGDSINRRNISEAQREIVSALLTEASSYWVNSIASDLNTTTEEIRSLWSDAGIKTPYDYRRRGFITGVRYLDQIEKMLQVKYSDPPKKTFIASIFGMFGKENATVNSTLSDDYMVDFDLAQDFEKYPRRNYTLLTTESSAANSSELNASKSAKEKKTLLPVYNIRAIPAGLYLRKMRKAPKVLQGLRIKETTTGKRIAVINAVGGINTGESSDSGLQGKSLGSDTLIAMIRAVKANPLISALVLRVDSPGGSALASDLMWREIRSLARTKPVVASMVDVAASGGYYLSMACDQIVAEELTITGSIGVVTAKFNNEKLNKRIGMDSHCNELSSSNFLYFYLGFGVDTLSIGRYAEVKGRYYSYLTLLTAATLYRYYRLQELLQKMNMNISKRMLSARTLLLLLNLLQVDQRLLKSSMRY